MGLVEELLGCSLLQLDRSWWAVKLKNPDEWVCEARVKTDVYRGTERHFDWTLDLVANSDVMRITELWLLCPPSHTSPLGNTARLVITEPGTAFQFKIGMADSSIAATLRSTQAHIVGRLDDKENGNCTCFVWDYVQEGLLTPETMIYDPLSGGPRRDANGNIEYVGRTNVTKLHSWRSSLAPPGRMELNTVGVRL